MKLFMIKFGGFGIGIDTFYNPFSIHFTLLFWEIAIYFNYDEYERKINNAK